jgi:hypothetical protein
LDDDSGLAHSLAITAANEADVEQYYRCTARRCRCWGRGIPERLNSCAAVTICNVYSPVWPSDIAKLPGGAPYAAQKKKQKQKAEAEAQQGRTWAREGGAFVQSNHNDPSWGFEVDLHQPSVLSQK